MSTILTALFPACWWKALVCRPLARRAWRKDRGSSRTRSPHLGQALVEFALLVTILSLLLVGVVDFSRVFYYDIVLSSAANEGARTVANGASNTTAATVIQASAGPLGSSLSFAPGSDISPGETGRGADDNVTNSLWVTVRVRYSFQPITPLVGGLLGNTITIERNVSQQLRTPCCY
jgi:Flp pilus assembly protein TadG